MKLFILQIDNLGGLKFTICELSPKGMWSDSLFSDKVLRYFIILSTSWELLSLVVPFSQTTGANKCVWFPPFKSSSFDSYRSYTCQKNCILNGRMLVFLTVKKY